MLGTSATGPRSARTPAPSSVEKIPTFAMAALAGIGAMPDTIEDRAVVIRMRRRAPGETVAPYRHRRDRPALHRPRATPLAAWMGEHLAELEHAEPAMPLEDRAADTWEPLIASPTSPEATGPNGPATPPWCSPTSGRTANVSDRIRLLVDCRAAFGDADALPTTICSTGSAPTRKHPGPTTATAG